MLKRTGTCLLSAAAGICASAFLGGVAKPTTDIATVAKDERGGLAAESIRERREGAATTTPGRAAGATKAADYRKAWDAIAHRNLTPAERVELQKRLLEQWSLVDLEGAMEAALENSWEGELDKLLTAFGGAFTKNPIEAWRIIQSGTLGPGSAWFRWQWLDSVSKENPLLVLSYFHELPTGLRRTGLSQVMRKHPGNPEVISAARRMLEGMPADSVTKGLAADYFDLVPPTETPAELGARWAAATTEREKLIALQALIGSLRKSDMATIRAEWMKLPPDARKDLTSTLLTSPTMLPPTDLLDLVIENGNWEMFKDPRISGMEGALAKHARTAEPIALAEWGLRLPDRPETLDVFRRAVSGYIDKNYMEARDWIFSIPEGDWRRERALAEYSQNALWAKKDPEGSQWAIDRIKDPKIKGTVINWRKEWTERTGRK
ncbi:hypothetical protein OVA24_18035 [Luteolibacter sp. SL250]|uniref:hypothetical protein n=1 Tax=Luteolibacter sp. SL250 TaxID=2995170 RepID=UPI00226DC3AD|nr:hypothetical protein [Luteolibacter sp. SL250]WAC19130.1 hypothetical protein OVA24_18035 [Luteolibacter sp. SL250]